jgi:rubrerythrin
MTGTTDNHMPIANLGELLAYAHAIEVDAIDRYNLLADQMEVHNNLELATLFRELAGHEEKHAAEILAQAGAAGLPKIDEGAMDWPGAESPEAADLDLAHYRMTPWHALQMALAAERRAFAFFDYIAGSVDDEDVKKWACEFREEEAEHVRLVEKLLKRHRQPPAGWDADDDPPVYQE